MKTLRLIALTALMLPIIIGCEHKPLESMIPSLLVHYDWDKYSKPAPETMKCYMFPYGSDNAPFTNEALLNARDGGSIEDISSGSYNVISFTEPVENVLSRCESWSSIEFYTPELVVDPALVPRYAGTEDETLVSAPGEVACAVDNVTTDFTEIKPWTDVTLSPVFTMTDVNVVVKKFEGLGRVKTAYATLSGMSGSYFPTSKSFSSDPSTVMFYFQDVDVKAGSMDARFCCFGDCQTSVHHYVVLCLITNNGSLLKYTRDVTAEVDAGAPLQKIYIEITDIGLPIDGDTFQPDVDGWIELNNEIKL